MDADKTDSWIIGLLDEEGAVFSLFWSIVAAGDGGRSLPFRPAGRRTGQAGRLCYPFEAWHEGIKAIELRKGTFNIQRPISKGHNFANHRLNHG
jgi:hypothetical protein